MKKWILIIAAVAALQNRERIENWLNPPEPIANVAREDVVLYATSWCGYCAKTRTFFAERGIPYIEYDIERSDEGREQFEALGGRGVPVVKAKGQVIFGYAPDQILAALK